MLISYVYLSSAIGTTAALSGLPALVKMSNLLSILEDSLRVTLMDKQQVSASSSGLLVLFGLLAVANIFVPKKFTQTKEVNQAYRKNDVSSLVFSLLPVAVVFCR